jgi:hypothetical protein
MPLKRCGAALADWRGLWPLSLNPKDDDMTLTADTLAELKAARHADPLGFDLEKYNEYFLFIRKWMAFNRAYSELITTQEKQENDRDKMLAIAKRLQPHWLEITDLAKQLASMECIGGDETTNPNHLLQPNKWTKSAMLYLREYFNLTQSADPANCQFSACRSDKKRLCNAVDIKGALSDWQGRGEMAALLRVVHQVRCNLVHGDKRLAARGAQTRRDSDLIQVSSQILDHVLKWLINAP